MPGFFKWQRVMQTAPELTATDRHVGLAIGLHANVNTGTDAYPSITTIANEAARKRGTVIDSIAWLERSGWLLVERRRLPGKQARDKSYYTLNTPTQRVTKAERDAWLKARASTRGGTRVVSEEAPAHLVPVENEGGTSMAPNLVPEGAPELPTTSPRTSPKASSTAVESYVRISQLERHYGDADRSVLLGWLDRIPELNDPYESTELERAIALARCLKWNHERPQTLAA